MRKVAKLVTISLQTRVIVDENATEEQIIRCAKPGFINAILCCAGDNIEEIVDDLQCPYGAYDADHEQRSA